MANSFFRFKQFTVRQEACAMKVCTDACLFGAWCAKELEAQTTPEQNLLDIGAGTGLLSLLIRQKNTLTIDAIEIDAAAAAQAQENVQASPWADSIRISNADVLNMMVLKSYDYIVSNPPFYENDLQSPDEARNTALHSRNLTLQQLLSLTKKHLDESGKFFLLLPYRRRDDVHALAEKAGLHFTNEVLVQQTKTHAPFRIMLRGGFEKRELKTTTVSIAGEGQPYTPEAVALLKDYYLYL